MSEERGEESAVVVCAGAWQLGLRAGEKKLSFQEAKSPWERREH